MRGRRGCINGVVYLPTICSAIVEPGRNDRLGTVHTSIAGSNVLCKNKTFPALPQSAISLSVTQSAFASTNDRPLCFPCAYVGLIGPRPSDFPHALSACYYFLQAVFLLELGLWRSLPARQLSHDTSYSFLTFSVFFCLFLKY